MRGVRLTAPCLLAACASTAPPMPEVVSLDGEHAVVQFEDEVVAQVAWSAAPKPFVYPLCAPGGLAVTRGFPMEELEGEAHDHPHHQSMWFAHGDVNGHDFWHGSEHDERIVALGPPRSRTTATGARLACEYEWRVDEGEVVCLEGRELDFARTPGANQLDATFRLSPTTRAVVFGDTKEGTFAVRLRPELRVEGERAAGHLLNSEGLVDGAVWGQRARWVDAHGLIEGQQVGLAIFDHPDNPNHPTWWHARKYGLLAANPFGVHDFEGAPPGSGDLELPRGETLELRYRVLVHAGDWDAERIEAAYQAWLRE